MGWSPAALLGEKRSASDEIDTFNGGPGYGEHASPAASRDEKDVVDNDRTLQPGALTLDETAAGGLGRHLGVVDTTMLIIGRIIGTGIFSTPASITAGVGSFGAAIMLWLLGLALACSGLAVWLEFGSMFPRSGGEKVYLEAVYTRPRYLATIVFSVQAILLGFTASGCIVFASNILVAANTTVSEWAERGIAIGVIVFITCIHTFTPRAGVWIMNLLGSLKIIILLFIVITGWVVLSGRVSSVPDPHASFRNSFANSSTSSSNYATALFKVINSYVGYTNAAYVLNEVKRPVRTLKIAGPLGLGFCGLMYMLANVAYFAAATPDEISKAGSTTLASYFFGKVFGAAAKRALSVIIALSAFGNVMTVTFAQARVNQELAKEGVIPFARFWASAWPFGAPSAGLLLHFIPSFIVIVAIPFGDAYNFIIDVEGYPQAIINFAVVVGLFILRWRAPEVVRPFRCWLPVAFFFMAGQAFLIVTPFIRPPGGKGDTSLPYWLYPVVGLAVLLAAVVAWFVWWVAMPRVGRFEWRTRKEVTDRGITITKFEKVKSN